jgi:hypothetical protein
VLIEVHVDGQVIAVLLICLIVTVEVANADTSEGSILQQVSRNGCSRARQRGSNKNELNANVRLATRGIILSRALVQQLDVCLCLANQTHEDARVNGVKWLGAC